MGVLGNKRKQKDFINEQRKSIPKSIYAACATPCIKTLLIRDQTQFYNVILDT